jgi:hypothetical protein
LDTPAKTTAGAATTKKLNVSSSTVIFRNSPRL